jgi:hypothetical protein
MYHRLVYRNAWLLQQLAEKQLADSKATTHVDVISPTATFATPHKPTPESRFQVAKVLQTSLFQLKTKLFQFWITTYERPGKYYVYAHTYTLLLLELCKATKDFRILDLVLKRVKKNLVSYEFLWSRAIRKKAVQYAASLDKEREAAGEEEQEGSNENEGEEQQEQNGIETDANIHDTPMEEDEEARAFQRVGHGTPSKKPAIGSHDQQHDGDSSPMSIVAVLNPTNAD